MAPDLAGGLRVPKIGHGRSRAQKTAPEGRGPKTPQWKNGQKPVGYSLGGGRGRSSSAGLGMAPDLAGGLRVPKIGHGHSRAQKTAPEVRGPKTPQRKNGQKTVGYSLGGVRWRSSSAGLGMAPDLAGGLRVPKIGHGHSRAQKAAPEVRGPKTPQRKNGQKTVGYSLGGGRGRSSSVGLGMAPDLAGGLRVPKIGHGHSRAQKTTPEVRGPKTPQRKNGQKTGGL